MSKFKKNSNFFHNKQIYIKIDIVLDVLMREREETSSEYNGTTKAMKIGMVLISLMRMVVLGVHGMI